MDGDRCEAPTIHEFLEEPSKFLPKPEFLTTLLIDDDSVLTHCIKTQNVSAVEQLLLAGADPNQLSRKGVAPISAAAHKGNTAIMQLLLAAGATVNSLNSTGSTALIQAAHFGHLEAVKLLLQYKAASDFANSKGTTALMRSCQEGHVQISKCLIQADVDVNRKNHEGMNALMLASQRGHSEIVFLLVKAGASMDEQTSQGSTALMLACKRGHEKCAEVLVAMGAEIFMRDRRLRTARDTATRRNHLALLRWLDTQVQVRQVQEARYRVRKKLLESLRIISEEGKLKLSDVISCLQSLYITAKHTLVAPSHQSSSSSSGAVVVPHQLFFQSYFNNYADKYATAEDADVTGRYKRFLVDIVNLNPSLPIISKSSDATITQLIHAIEVEGSYNQAVEKIPVYNANNRVMVKPTNCSNWQWPLLLNKCLSKLPTGIFELVMDFLPTPRVWQWSLLRLKRRCKLAPHQAVLDMSILMDEILCDSLIFGGPDQKYLMFKISSSPQIHRLLIDKLDMSPTLVMMLCSFGQVQGTLMNFGSESEVTFKYPLAKQMLTAALSLFRWFRVRSSGLKLFHMLPSGPALKSGLGYGPLERLMNQCDLTEVSAVEMADVAGEEASDYDIDLLNAIEHDTETEMVVDDGENDESDSENEHDNMHAPA